MAEGLEKLAELKTAKPKAEKTTDAKDADKTASNEAPVYTQKLDAQGRAYATGNRKTAIARVWIKPGKGAITVNGRDQTVYFARPTQRMKIQQPFEIVEREGEFDVVCTVTGSGLSGQAEAVRHGISIALMNYEPGLRPILKKAGLLTRDARRVEPKKFGRRKARRRKQWKKR